MSRRTEAPGECVAEGGHRHRRADRQAGRHRRSPCRRSTRWTASCGRCSPALSSRPELANWLATDDLVRQLAAAIDQASAGASPARDFKVHRAGVAIRRRRDAADRRTIDPASYRRYDGLVRTVTSIDASRVAKIYKHDPPAAQRGVSRHGQSDRDVDNAAAQRARHPARHAGRQGSDRVSSKAAARAGHYADPKIWKR